MEDPFEGSILITEIDWDLMTSQLAEAIQNAQEAFKDKLQVIAERSYEVYAKEEYILDREIMSEKIQRLTIQVKQLDNQLQQQKQDADLANTLAENLGQTEEQNDTIASNVQWY